MEFSDWIPPFFSLFSKTTLLGAVLVALAATVFMAIVKRFDGPFGPIPGGPLRAGELIEEPLVDWRSISQVRFGEIETVSTRKSRVTGLIEYEGSLFIPCDLGFIWRRVSPPAKWVMAIFWLVKRWHKDVSHDGRVVVRIRGHRYALQAIRVEAPAMIDSLKSEVNEEAQKLMGERLAPRADQDDEIWFFRLDPR